MLFNLLNSLLPRHCLFCLEKTQNSTNLCTSCLKTLTLNSNCCQRCASPMEYTPTQHKLLCGNCLSHQYFYDKVYSPYTYAYDIRYIITKLKYHKKIHLAKILAELFTQQAPFSAAQDNEESQLYPLPQLIIPMPMHTKRLRERGYNQALEISRFLASYYQLPLDYKYFVRTRYTQLQAGLAASERQKNVANAFTVKKPLNYNHIALVDDVMTTGSTVNEAAKILKKNGIKQVDVWTIARAGVKH